MKKYLVAALAIALCSTSAFADTASGKRSKSEIVNPGSLMSPADVKQGSTTTGDFVVPLLMLALLAAIVSSTSGSSGGGGMPPPPGL